MKSIKYLSILVPAILMVGCGSETTISKPTTERGFQPAASPVTRTVASFSAEDKVVFEAIKDELKQYNNLTKGYISSEKDYPSAELTPKDFKYGNGDAIVEAYTKYLTDFNNSQTHVAAQVKREQAELQAKVDSEKTIYEGKVAAFNDSASSIIPLEEKEKSINDSVKKTDKEYSEATKKITDIFNTMLVDNSIPVSKVRTRSFQNVSYRETTCETLGYRQERYNVVYSIQYSPNLCIDKNLPRLTPEQSAVFTASEDFTSLLNDTVNLQTRVLLEQGNLRLKKTELNGYTQQLNEVKRALKDQYVLFRNKTNKSYSQAERDIKSADNDYNRAVGELERFDANIESHKSSLLNETFYTANKLSTDFSNAVSEYANTHLKSIMTNFEVVDDAVYETISYSYDEKKPLLIVFDSVKGGELTEIYIINTKKINSYVEKHNPEGSLALKTLAQGRLIDGDVIRHKVDDYYGIAMKIASRFSY